MGADFSCSDSSARLFCYGQPSDSAMAGTNTSEDNLEGDNPDRDYTLLLPDEVLEEVFEYVPSLDLVMNARLVSKRWQRVLQSKPLWRNKSVLVRTGRERDACRVLRYAPALYQLELFIGDRDRSNSRRLPMVLAAVRHAAKRGIELHALSIDWLHFAKDQTTRACFHGILEALKDTIVDLDVGLVGLQAVEDGATPLRPHPTPAFAALAGLKELQSLRIRSLFDPNWYYGEMGKAAHKLHWLDASGCESLLSPELLTDLVTSNSSSLAVLRLTGRSMAALSKQGKELHLPALMNFILDLEHQDGRVEMDFARPTCRRVRRLTLSRMNRRLPLPGQDNPSEAVSSLCYQRPWAEVRTLVLEDCLFSPADLAELLDAVGPHEGLGKNCTQRGCDPGCDQEHGELVFVGGCFLGSRMDLIEVVGMCPDQRLTLDCQWGLRLCPRDKTTGLYPLALHGEK